MLGHGMTDKPDGDYMPPDYAAHILALMDTLASPAPTSSANRWVPGSRTG